MKNFTIILHDKDQRTHILEKPTDDRWTVDSTEKWLQCMDWVKTNEDYMLRMDHVVRFRVKEVV